MIEIDTSRYEMKSGSKPRGRAFWVFRIVSDSVTIADKLLSSDQPQTYEAAAKRAQEVAQLRKASQIILEPPPG